MNLSLILNAIQLSSQSKTVVEILELNEQTKEHGLVLRPNDVQTLIIARNKVLSDYSRVELGTNALKSFIEVFSTSPYMEQTNYVNTLIELQEIFYYLRNETEDRIGDARLIQIMKEYFDEICAGSFELLKSHMEKFAEDFRMDLVQGESFVEGGSQTWK